MKRVGIVVVTHNSESQIGACLDAVAGSGAEVVVVDNASRDGTRQEVLRRPGMRLLANPWNRGFAAAVNQGIHSLAQETLLVLNPDVEVLGGLEALVDACSQPGVAAAAGQLVDEQGRPQAGFMVRRLPGAAALALEVLGVNRLWPGNPVNRRYRCLDLDPETACAVEQPAGAFLALRREVWQRLGGFDERFYPLWFEDVDYCRRAREAALEIRYVPEARARHQGGHSARQLAAKSRELYWYGNLLTYAAKHLRPVPHRLVCLAVVLGSLFRTIWGIFRRGSLQPVAVYATVIRLAGRALFSGQDEGTGLASASAGGR